MTPSQVYELTDDEYRAFVRYMREEIKAREKAARSRKR
jgi:hypothetical protein